MEIFWNINIAATCSRSISPFFKKGLDEITGLRCGACLEVCQNNTPRGFCIRVIEKQVRGVLVDKLLTQGDKYG